MARKVILITDPGIDGAYALAAALHDDALEVLGVVATAGNVSAEQATRNVEALIEQMDPPRWPRLGAALPISYDLNGLPLNGPGGLGGVELPFAQLHHQHSGDKLIGDLVRLHPKEISILVLGPATVLALTLDRDPEVSSLLNQIILVGGCWRAPGDATATAELHIACDPVSARKLLHSGLPLTMLPLDVTRKPVFSPSELLQQPEPVSTTCRLLRQLAPHGIMASASLFGIEGMCLPDVVGVAAVSQPGLVTCRRVIADVETRGQLTAGMLVLDTRWAPSGKPNVDLGVEIDEAAVKQYLARVLYLNS